MIRIIDYGMGNLRSVQKALERLGYASEITSDPDSVANADRIVLPGVGAFGDAMVKLSSLNLIEPIKNHVLRGRPFLGICLGLQLLFDESEENGIHQGLSLLRGRVISFQPNLGIKVPHMGWNALRVVRPCPLFAEVPSGAFVYFVHSFYAVPGRREIVAAEADYPTPFAAAIHSENVFATQFHPEKSQEVGLRILRNFVERC
ncbi:MAG: imidazole glycerol phosphate synthase subunit HisH [Gemmataceae bacterium]|nr:imidazole glycerol phosphate synthase subunit HisH [Gemmataceae bacterium]